MTIKTFAEAEQQLSQALPGYESRTQQQVLAQTVEQALAGGRHAMVQAGCGTGKSFGAMIPAILWAQQGKRVVVSTATKALQDQYSGGDLPFLEQHLGVPFSWALLKGRSNYACLAKINDLTIEDAPYKPALEDELAEPGQDGDVEHLAIELTDQQRRDITATTDECPGKKTCKFGKVCFAEAAKAKARAANVVVVNHALTFTDLKVRQVTDGKAAMLGEYDAVIFDEAHEIEEWATSALGDSFRIVGIRRLAATVANFFANQNREDLIPEANKLVMAAERVWDLLPDATESQATSVSTRFFLEQEEVYAGLVFTARDLAKAVSDVEVKNENAENHRAMLATRLSHLADRVSEVMLADDDSMIRWVEATEIKGHIFKSLNSAPLHVGTWLAAWLWNRVPSVLMSATLSVGRDFSYVQERIGLPDPITKDVGTPFDYDAQSLLYIPGPGTPDPRDRSAWLSVAAATTEELVRASGGGALLLYTSRSAMRSAYATLAERFEAQGFRVLMQGEGATNRELAAEFRADENSVLFALKSFMTGVDFSGDTCRLVVIDKLPFPVPSDVIFQARAADLDRKARRKVSFSKMAIPAMTLTLHQAFGRLIRTKADRGIVAILDSRLVTTPYGRGIVGNLPDCQVTYSLADVQQFYTE